MRTSNVNCVVAVYNNNNHVPGMSIPGFFYLEKFIKIINVIKYRV